MRKAKFCVKESEYFEVESFAKRSIFAYDFHRVEGAADAVAVAASRADCLVYSLSRP